MSNPLLDKLFELSEEDRANLYKNIFDSEAGRLVLEDLKQRCFMRTTTFTPSHGEISFKEGMRAVCLHIESQINYQPEQGDNNAMV